LEGFLFCHRAFLVLSRPPGSPFRIQLVLFCNRSFRGFFPRGCFFPFFACLFLLESPSLRRRMPTFPPFLCGVHPPFWFVSLGSSVSCTSGSSKARHVDLSFCPLFLRIMGAQLLFQARETITFLCDQNLISPSSPLSSFQIFFVPRRKSEWFFFCRFRCPARLVSFPLRHSFKREGVSPPSRWFSFSRLALTLFFAGAPPPSFFASPFPFFSPED